MNPIDLSNYNRTNMFIYLDKYDQNLKKYVPTLLEMTW